MAPGNHIIIQVTVKQPLKMSYEIKLSSLDYV